MRRVAGIGPVSMKSGSSPTTANAWNRARGVSPSSIAFSSLMISAAEAPSVSGEELPGVIRQSRSGNRAASSSVRNDGFRPPSPSIDGAGAHGLVGGHRRIADRDGEQLGVEQAAGCRIRRPPMRLGRVGVEHLARQAPLLGDELGRDALVHEAVGIALVEAARTANRPRAMIRAAPGSSIRPRRRSRCRRHRRSRPARRSARPAGSTRTAGRSSSQAPTRRSRPRARPAARCSSPGRRPG